MTVPVSTRKKQSSPQIITLEEVVAKSVFDKEFANLKNDLKTQSSLTWQVVTGVAVAWLLAIGVVIYDSVSSREIHADKFSSVEKEINSQTLEINNLKNNLDNLHIRNPYLK